MGGYKTNELIWRSDHECYELRAGDEVTRFESTPDSHDWAAWLEQISSFSFRARSGIRCTARKETVQRGGTYWYAYRRANKRLLKRYLGRGAELSPSRLEEVAATLSDPGSAEDHQAVPPAGRRANQSDLSGVVKAHSGSHLSEIRSLGAASSPTNFSDWETLPDHLLLSTKLHVPRSPAPLMSRPAVNARLQRGLERPLTLVTGPAGFGKTTALSVWVRQLGRPVAWVSLDSGDNDPVQFWTYVLTALNRAYPGLIDPSLAVLHAGRPTIPVPLLRTLLNATVATDRDVVLVLDDYHVITVPTIHHAIAEALEHPPTGLHLYLASRSEPPLPLARLRARDQVVELGADDLRFDHDDVDLFLRDVVGVTLSSDDVARLAERTEGWVAGVRLAGLSLQGQSDPPRFMTTFGGSHRHVATYLGEEVLATQPDEIQEFLLQTSILDRICGPLADVITDRSDGRDTLEQLLRANLFVVPLDDEGRWYRYHHLFVDALRQRLRQNRADEIPTLHRRAARWLEREGWVLEAAEHLLAVPAPTEAAHLIERVASDLIARGDFVTFQNLIERLPEEIMACHPRLCVYHALMFMSFAKIDAAEKRIACAERYLASGRTNEKADQSEVADRRALAGLVAAARAELAVLRGDGAEAMAFAQQANAVLPDDDVFTRGQVGVALGLAYQFAGKTNAAAIAFADARRLNLAAGNVPMLTLAMRLHAYLLWPKGRLHAAASLLRQVIQIAEAQSGSTRSLAGGAYAGLSTPLYEWNDLVAAKLASEKAISLGQQWSNAEDQVDGLMGLLNVQLAQGQLDGAAESLRRAEQVVAANTMFPWTHALCAVGGVRLALRQGRIDQALRWAEERGLASGPDQESVPQGGENAIHEIEYLTFARVLIAQEKFSEADSVLAYLLRTAEAEDRPGSIITIRVMQARVWHALGATDRALDALGEAVSLAALEGYCRTFVDEGAPIRALLGRLRERQPKGSTQRRVVTSLLSVFGQGAMDDPRRPTRGSLIEPLSGREREVLDLIAQGRSNQEIAQTFVVALSTVKSHVNRLFDKLDASDRLQAVTRARELGLLER